MQKQFQSNIIKNQLFNKNSKLLLAISGGVDSVVLAHLLKEGNYEFSLAHCNYKLRGKESDGDEQFCRKLAKELGVSIFVKVFDLKKKKGKINIQSEARELRYSWFNELINQHELDCVLTAHHANDHVETVLINLLRGTGSKGMKGIRARNGKRVRPLLVFTKKEIEAYARKNKLDHRLDKSNLEAKYERNFLRLKVVPLLKELNPSLEKTFIENSFRMGQEYGMAGDYLKSRYKELVTEGKDFVNISKTKLKKEKYIESVLHFLLDDYGFNETQNKNIIDNIMNDGESGKLFHSPTHKLTIGRSELVIVPNNGKKLSETIVRSLSELKKHFSVSEEKKFTLPSQNELFIYGEQLRFPLTIRTYRAGDKFRPFGMKGFKLLSDFLKSEKQNAFEKENCRILVNGNGDIIWVMGLRSDERYRVDPDKKNYLKLSIE
ncbi:MAG: tilS [Bacteroidetes bacterium]|nr:tilS [Bacteroidota bacterium]